VLTLDLVAAHGTWYPEAGAGPGREIFAFGERLENLSNPGPLIRVPVGTEVRATVRNHIEGETLVVHGLHANDCGFFGIGSVSVTGTASRYRPTRRASAHEQRESLTPALALPALPGRSV
jgi:hypothetical protein